MKQQSHKRSYSSSLKDQLKKEQKIKTKKKKIVQERDINERKTTAKSKKKKNRTNARPKLRSTIQRI